MSKPTVAVIGASADRSKFGNKSVRAHLQAGYEVYPVNPKGDAIEGLTAYTRVVEVPVETLDRVTLYLPPKLGIALLDDIAEKGCRELYLNPGTSSPELVDKARSLGLKPVEACSIVDLGLSPSQFT